MTIPCWHRANYVIAVRICCVSLSGEIVIDMIMM